MTAVDSAIKFEFMRSLGADELIDYENEDFTKNGDLISFIQMYSNSSINKDALISYEDYNWKLNE